MTKYYKDVAKVASGAVLGIALILVMLISQGCTLEPDVLDDTTLVGNWYTSYAAFGGAEIQEIYKFYDDGSVQNLYTTDDGTTTSDGTYTYNDSFLIMVFEDDELTFEYEFIDNYNLKLIYTESILSTTYFLRRYNIYKIFS